MDFNTLPPVIDNSDKYATFISLFEDFEIIEKLTKQRIEENNYIATMRCMNMMRLVVNELKSFIM